MNIIEAINSGQKFTADCEASRRWFSKRSASYLCWDREGSCLCDSNKGHYEPLISTVKNWKLKPYRGAEEEVSNLTVDFAADIISNPNLVIQIRKIYFEALKPYIKEEL